MNCADCKYHTSIFGSLYCMGQKYMPLVPGDGLCDSYKPIIITNAEKHFRNATDEEIAKFLEKTEACSDDKHFDCRYQSCYECWLAWLKKDSNKIEGNT